MKSLVLVDGNAFMHRAYHAVKFAPTYNGAPVGMVYGMVSMMLNIIETFSPDILVVAFDTKEKTFRHDMDENYKAHREKADDDFYSQIPLVYEFLEAFEVPVLKAPGFEADDIVGTLAVRGAKEGLDVKILSGDLDFLQLVSEHIVFVKPNGKIQDSLLYGPDETVARLGVSPAQIIDYKAIVGDSSDNYKGVAGLGPKAAVGLLEKYETLENVYEHLAELPASQQKKLEEGREQAFHCQALARIKTDVTLDFSFDLENSGFRFAPASSIAFLEKIGFVGLLSRYHKLINKCDQGDSVEQQSGSSGGGAGAESSEQLSLF